MSVKKKHKGLKITICVLLVLLVGAGIFAVRQSNNIKALIYMQKYTPQQRAEKQKENDEAVQRILDSVPEASGIKSLTEEEEKKLQSGELSESEALEIIMGEPVGSDFVSSAEPTGGNNTPSDRPSENSASGTSDSVDSDSAGVNSDSAADAVKSDNADDGAQLKKLFARVYLLRSSFTGQLNSLISQAKAELKSPEAEGNAVSIANKYYSLGTSLEAECDSQMESLLSQIKAELERTGGDTSVAEQIRSAYQNEKSLTKSALIEKYKK